MVCVCDGDGVVCEGCYTANPECGGFGGGGGGGGGGVMGKHYMSLSEQRLLVTSIVPAGVT